MTCQECELRLAEGEFGAAVEDHLLECAECRALAAELRENAIALAAMREDELSGGAGFSPRTSVRPIRPQVWIAAAAAALVLLTIGLPRHRRETPLPPAPVVAAVPAPAPVVAASAPVAAAVTRKRTHRTATVRERVPPKPAQPEETFMVKMLTPDPDVVVYWIVEPKEKAE